jgi:hypothetical protein
MKVNRELLWDHDFSEEDYETESFKDWYLARTITDGNTKDIQNAGGIPEIRKCFIRLHLPLETERLWSWYLNIPGPRTELYERSHLFSRIFP